MKFLSNSTATSIFRRTLALNGIPYKSASDTVTKVKKKDDVYGMANVAFEAAELQAQVETISKRILSVKLRPYQKESCP